MKMKNWATFMSVELLLSVQCEHWATDPRSKDCEERLCANRTVQLLKSTLF